MPYPASPRNTKSAHANPSPLVTREGRARRVGDQRSGGGKARDLVLDSEFLLFEGVYSDFVRVGVGGFLGQRVFERLVPSLESFESLLMAHG